MQRRYTLVIFFILTSASLLFLAIVDPMRPWKEVDQQDLLSEGLVALFIVSWVAFLHWIQFSRPVFWLLYLGFSAMALSAFEDFMDEWTIIEGLLAQVLANVFSPLGMLLVSIGLFRWGLEQRRAQQHFQTLSETDTLTGLGNRSAFDRQLQPASKAQDSRALLMLDIDDFKEINDTFGHTVGDRVIQHLAGIVLSVLRKNDLAFRYGGEEFAILLQDIPIEAVLGIAKRILNSFSEERFEVEGQSFSPRTVSIGIAYTASSIDAANWLEQADQALYSAKREGKNRIKVVVV